MHFSPLKIDMVALISLFNGLQFFGENLKKQQKEMGRGGRALRFLFGVTVLMGVFWLLFVAIIANHGTPMTKSIMVRSTRDFKHWEFVGQGWHNSHQDFHLNYVSKRRVPNGPNPIHNRRAAKAREPPGRA